MEIDSTRAEAIERIFRENFEQWGELGASVSIWREGEEVVHLSAGYCERAQYRSWRADTLAPCFSATKGLSAAAFLLALDEAGLDLSDAVRDVWPELSAGGGGELDRLTFGELISHQAGLPCVDEPVSILDYGAVVEALEGQGPLWSPGEAHGYHARTWGFMLDELIRRIADVGSLGEFWRKRIAEPLGLDLWIGGLPESEYPRVATIYPGRPGPEGLGDDVAFYNAYGRPESLTYRSFRSLRGLDGIKEFNNPAAWELGLAAMGGLATAAGLAKFYGLLASGEGGGIFSEKVLGWMEKALVDGEDRVFLRRTAFSAGFLKDPADPLSGRKLRAYLGPSMRAFGHPGAGGSHAFADPEHGIGFAYTMNQMQLGVLPNRKSLRMVEALYEGVRGCE